MMRSLRKSAMELGETRQLVIPCQRCGESRVILAKQGRDSNTLSESVNGDPILRLYVYCLWMDGTLNTGKLLLNFLPFFVSISRPTEKSLGNVSNRA